MSILRDIFRRKTRSILTISGIAIGAFTLVTLGSFAENDNVYVEQLTGYFEDVIIVTEERDANFVGMANGNRPLSMDTLAELRACPGVRNATPMISLMLDDTYNSIIPRLVMGGEPGAVGTELADLAEGRDIGKDERGVTVLGSDLAKQKSLSVGDTFEIRDEPFKVVGIMERTYVNLSDSAAYINLPDAQHLFYQQLPEAFRAGIDPNDLVHQITLHAEDGVDDAELAEQLNRDIEGIKATSSSEMLKAVSSMVALANVLIGAMGVLALLIGGLSIINTMTMSVSERTREIGVKRALGASRRQVATDILVESAVMGAIGGALGVAAGALVATAMNEAMVAFTGTSAFLVTGRLALGALIVAVVVGIIGGLYPARFASRMEPAVALAYE